MFERERERERGGGGGGGWEIGGGVEDETLPDRQSDRDTKKKRGDQKDTETVMQKDTDIG